MRGRFLRFEVSPEMHAASLCFLNRLDICRGSDVEVTMGEGV